MWWKGSTSHVIERLHISQKVDVVERLHISQKVDVVERLHVSQKVDVNENENLFIAHKNLPLKTLRVHSARYTQCIHVSSRKLKLPKDMHSYPPTPFQKWNYT